MISIVDKESKAVLCSDRVNERKSMKPASAIKAFVAFAVLEFSDRYGASINEPLNPANADMTAGEFIGYDSAYAKKFGYTHGSHPTVKDLGLRAGDWTLSVRG